MEETIQNSSLECDFFSLPTALQIDVLCEWGTIKQLAKVDSAICNSILRPLLLILVKEKHFRYTELHHLDRNHFVSWVGLRGIKLLNVAVSKNIMDPASGDLFDSMSSHIEEAMFPMEMSTAPSVSFQHFVDHASKCVELQNLTIFNLNMFDANIAPLLTKRMKLHTLHLSGSTNLELSKIIKYGGNLKVLEISFCQSTVVETFPAVSTQLYSLILQYSACLAIQKCFTEFVGSNIELRELYMDAYQEFDFLPLLQRCTKLIVLALSFNRVTLSPLPISDVPVYISHFQNILHLQCLGADTTYLFWCDEILLLVLQGCKQLITLVTCSVNDDDRAAILPDSARSALIPKPTPSSAVSTARSALKTLHVRTISASTLSLVFDLCPQLSELGIGRFDSVVELQQTIQLMRDRPLRCIELMLHDDYDFDSIHLLTNLTSLYLYNCTNLTNAHLLILAQNNPNLTELQLSECGNVNTVTVSAVLALCTQLTRFSVVNSTASSRHFDLLHTLRAQYPKLIHLRIDL